jgi:hypothetical protein
MTKSPGNHKESMIIVRFLDLKDNVPLEGGRMMGFTSQRGHASLT